MRLRVACLACFVKKLQSVEGYNRAPGRYSLLSLCPPSLLVQVSRNTNQSCVIEGPEGPFIWAENRFVRSIGLPIGAIDCFADACAPITARQRTPLDA